MSSGQKSLDLLFSSLEKGTSSKSSKEWELLRSILQSETLWNENVGGLLSLLKCSHTLDVCPLVILNDLISHCSQEQLRKSCQKWVEYLTGQLQKTEDLVTVQSACKCFSSLLDRCHALQKGLSDFTSRQLPTIMSSLLWFTASDPYLQCVALPVVTKCVANYPKPCGQFKGQITKWVHTGLFSPSQELSQECSRLLVLVYGPALMESLSTELILIMSCLYDQDTQVGNSRCVIDIPSIPSEEPARSALLLRLVCVFCRTLSYSLLFLSTASVSVPLDKLMGVILGGLELQQSQVSGLSYDKLLLHSLVPTIHSSLWSLLCTLIHACHAHLLPFTTAIEACIVREMTSDIESDSLILSVHRCICAWLSVRQDTDSYFATLITSSLLKAVNSTSECVLLSSLATLTSMIRTIGIYLPAPVCCTIKSLAMKGISLTTSPNLAVHKLDLLLACASSSNGQLQPNVGGVLNVFTTGRQHQSAKVREMCKNACVQCELIRHPMAPPVLTPHARISTEDTGLSNPFHLAMYKVNSCSSTLMPPSSSPLHKHKEQNLTSPMPRPQVSNESTPEPVVASSRATDETLMDVGGPLTETSNVVGNEAQLELQDCVTSTEAAGTKVRSASLSSEDSTEEDMKLFKAVPPDDPITT